MKYGLARFVWGFTGVTLIILGVGVFFTPQSEHGGIPKTRNEILLGAASAAIPVVLGILCFFRYRYWNREAGKKS